MREPMRKFTMGHPKQVIEPAIWHFLEGFTMTFPAVAVYFVINLLIEHFENPERIFDKGYLNIALWMSSLFLLQLIVSTFNFLRTFLPGAIHSTENKKDFIGKIKRLPLGFFSKTRSGELINTFTGDFLAIEQSMVATFTGLFGVVFSCIVTSVFMFYFNTKLALAFYITMPVSVIIIVISMKVFGHMSTRLRSAKDDTAEGLNEYLSGMKILRNYNQVGEGGSTLSGGEKQRISIARAILKNAPILLLDEPTSSLDAKNEVSVQKAISNLVKNKTVIMIAHRLKTIKNADHIIVLDQGRIAEEGNHEELLKKKGLYQKLWNLQNKSKEWKISSGGKKNEQ